MWRRNLCFLERHAVRSVKLNSYRRLPRHFSSAAQVQVVEEHEEAIYSSPSTDDVAAFQQKFVGAWESVLISEIQGASKMHEGEAEFSRFIETLHGLHINLDKSSHASWDEVNYKVFPFVYQNLPEMDRFKQFISVGEIMDDMQRRPYEREMIAVTDENCEEIISRDESALQHVHDGKSGCLVYLKNTPPTMNQEDLIRALNTVGPVKGVQIFRSKVVDSYQINKKVSRKDHVRFEELREKHTEREVQNFYERMAEQYHGSNLEFINLHDHPAALKEIKLWVTKSLGQDSASLEFYKDKYVLNCYDVLDEESVIQMLSKKLNVPEDQFIIEADKITIPNYADIWKSSRKHASFTRYKQRLKTIQEWLIRHTADTKAVALTADWTYEIVEEIEQMVDKVYMGDDIDTANIMPLMPDAPTPEEIEAEEGLIEERTNDGSKLFIRQMEKDLVVSGMKFLGGIVKELYDILQKYPDVYMEENASFFVGQAQKHKKWMHELKPCKAAARKISIERPHSEYPGTALVWFENVSSVEHALDPHMRVTGIQLKGFQMTLTECPNTIKLENISFEQINKWPGAYRHFPLYGPDYEGESVREDIHIPFPMLRKPTAPICELPKELQQTFRGLTKVWTRHPVRPIRDRGRYDVMAKLTEDYHVLDLDLPDNRSLPTLCAYICASGGRGDRTVRIHVAVKNMLVHIPAQYIHGMPDMQMAPEWKPKAWEHSQWGKWIPLVTLSRDSEEGDLLQSTSCLWNAEFRNLLSAKASDSRIPDQDVIFGSIAIYSYKPEEVTLSFHTQKPEAIKTWVNGYEVEDSNAFLQAGFNQFLFEFRNKEIPSFSLNNRQTGFIQPGLLWRYDTSTPAFIFEYDTPENAHTSLNNLRMLTKEGWDYARARIEFDINHNPHDSILQAEFSAPQKVSTNIIDGSINANNEEILSTNPRDILTQDTSPWELKAASDLGDIKLGKEVKKEEDEEEEEDDVLENLFEKEDDWDFLFEEEGTKESLNENSWHSFDNEQKQDDKNEENVNALNELWAIMQKTHQQDMSKSDFTQRKNAAFQYSKLLGRHKIVRQASSVSQFDTDQFYGQLTS